MLAEYTARNELSRLEDPRLFREQAYVGGKWTAAADGKVLAITNPANGARLGVVPALGAAETEAAIAAAAAAFPAWRRLLPQERAARLRRWYELMIVARADLALLMTLEQGKPLAEAEGEIAYAASFIEWFAEEAKRVNVESITPHLPNRQMSVRREPVGVVAAVTPWNFPSAMITRKAAAALAAGCTDGGAPGLRDAVLGAGPGRARRARRHSCGRVLGRHRRRRSRSSTRCCASPTVRALSASRARPRSAASCSRRGRRDRQAHVDGARRPRAVHRLRPRSTSSDAVAGAVAAKFQTSGPGLPRRQPDLRARRHLRRASSSASPSDVSGAEGRQRPRAGRRDRPADAERAVAKCAAHVADALAKGARVLAGGERHALGGSSSRRP